MVYDTSREVVVLYGGYDGRRLGDTWEWDGGAWFEASTSGPPASAGSSLSFDSSLGVSVLFDCTAATTWEWDGIRWSRVDSGLDPARRANAEMAFDTTRMTHVLFGGRIGDLWPNDTWERSGTDWSLVDLDTSPSGRSVPAFDFEPNSGSFLLFGGINDGIEVGDTWVYRVQDPISSCGDEICSHDEGPTTCPFDCPAVCGDEMCTHDESPSSCEVDCPARCGDRSCTHEESAGTCPIDCPARCGDGMCTHTESARVCPSDCEADCGDGECSGEESAETCGIDCPAECGDGACTHEENSSLCPVDCPAVCGDGACTHRELCETCPDDCGACPICEGHCSGDDIEWNVCTCAPEDVCGWIGDEFCDTDRCLLVRDDVFDDSEDCCGNDECASYEDCLTCPDDCGDCVVCGDGICEGEETGGTCPLDCLPDWTVLVYMVADNDMEFPGVEDLFEMSRVGSSEDVRILAQMDRAIGGYSGGVLNIAGDWTTAKRIRVESGRLTEISDIGEVDMGSSDTLSSFITWGISSEPAQRYMVVFWDHGSGWTKFGVDDSHDGNGLTLTEIRTGIERSLEETGVPRIDLIGFDACLMATIETAYQISDLADAMVAAEETEPMMGWRYDVFLGELERSESMTALDLGRAISDSFEAEVLRTGSWLGKYTLSVTDLSQVDETVARMDAFVGELRTFLRGGRSSYLAVAEARRMANSFPFTSGGMGSPEHLYDLGMFATRVGEIGGESVEAAAISVLESMEEAVTYQVSGGIHSPVSGMSIYFPSTEGEWLSTAESPPYLGIDFAIDTDWDEFLADFARFDDESPPVVGEVRWRNFDDHTNFYATVAGTDIWRNTFVVAEVFEEEFSSYVGVFPANEIDGVIRQDWFYYVYELTDFENYVQMPLFFVGSWLDGGTTYSSYVAPASYRGPTARSYTDVELYYVWDGLDIEFDAAFQEVEDTWGEISIEEGGTVHARWLIVPEDGRESFFHETSTDVDVVDGSPQVVWRLADASSYRVGFTSTDYAGNTGRSFADVVLRCRDDIQCMRSSAGSVCNLETGRCVECTEADDAACVGRTPHCVENECVQCRNMFDCVAGLDIYYQCGAERECVTCGLLTPCPDGWACDWWEGYCY